MLTLKGIYKDGVIKLNKPIKTDKSLKVIITFIDEGIFDEISDKEEIENINIDNFAFAASIEESKEFKGSLSKSLIEERREDL